MVCHFEDFVDSQVLRITYGIIGLAVSLGHQGVKLSLKLSEGHRLFDLSI